MKLATKIVLAVIFLVGYIFLINGFAKLVLATNGDISPSSIRTTISSGTAVELGFSDSVAIKLTRNRIYGKIIVDGNTEYLYLFKFLKLPKRVLNWNFMWFHIIFVIAFSLFLIFVKAKKLEQFYPESQEQNIYKGDYPFYYHEDLA